jgi:hypothetical protein
VVVDVAHLSGCPSAAQVLRRRAERELQVRDLPEHQVAVTHVAGVERDVEALVQELVRALGHAADLEPYVDLRIVHRERDDGVAHVVAADPLGTDDGQGAFGLVAQPAQRGFLAVDLVEDPGRELGVTGTGLGQADRPGRPVDQPHAGSPLQLGHVPGDQRS